MGKQSWKIKGLVYAMSFVCLGTTPAFAQEIQSIHQSANVRLVQTSDQTYEENSFEIQKNVLHRYQGTAETVVIPSGVKSVGAYAFAGCTTVKKIVIPKGVKSIGECAFADCSSLEEIQIPSSVTKFGLDVFQNTKWLKKKRKVNRFVIVNKILIDGQTCSGSITIPNGVIRINDAAFCKASKLKKVKVSNAVKSIGAYAFAYSKQLEKIELPNKVTEIGESAFFECKKLKEIKLSSAIKEVGADAFKGTKWLALQRKKSPMVLINHVFLDGKSCKGDVKIPKGVVTIAEDAFAECKTVTSITIPSTVKEIRSNAFFCCEALREITLPVKVTAIEPNTFCGCVSLTTLKLPEGVKTIGDAAFMSCSNLKEIYIPTKVTSISKDAFEECRNLVISGSKGSYAQKYAKKQKISFSVKK